MRSPQQIMYEKLLEIYKYNQDEFIKQEKFILRSKKKNNTYFKPKVIKPQLKYTVDDFVRDEERNHLKRAQAARKLQTFEEIYDIK